MAIFKVNAYMLVAFQINSCRSAHWGFWACLFPTRNRFYWVYKSTIVSSCSSLQQRLHIAIDHLLIQHSVQFSRKMKNKSFSMFQNAKKYLKTLLWAKYLFPQYNFFWRKTFQPSKKKSLSVNGALISLGWAIGESTSLYHETKVDMTAS